jgi:hypothetical protein
MRRVSKTSSVYSFIFVNITYRISNGNASRASSCGVKGFYIFKNCRRLEEFLCAKLSSPCICMSRSEASSLFTTPSRRLIKHNVVKKI